MTPYVNAGQRRWKLGLNLSENRSNILAFLYKDSQSGSFKCRTCAQRGLRSPWQRTYCEDTTPVIPSSSVRTESGLGGLKTRQRQQGRLKTESTNRPSHFIFCRSLPTGQPWWLNICRGSNLYLRKQHSVQVVFKGNLIWNIRKKMRAAGKTIWNLWFYLLKPKKIDFLF